MFGVTREMVESDSPGTRNVQLTAGRGRVHALFRSRMFPFR